MNDIVLVIVAHRDDETIGWEVTIAKHSNKGDKSAFDDRWNISKRKW